jgi:hypothetical protein
MGDIGTVMMDHTALADRGTHGKRPAAPVIYLEENHPDVAAAQGSEPPVSR